MTTTFDLLVAGQHYYLPVYRPREVILERGQGARVWDRDGNEYVDLSAGIADLSRYAVDPSKPLYPDLFLD